MSTSIIILETPFYTVSKTNEFAAFIELRSDTTDASPNKRPSNTEEIVQDGVVNYYGEPEPKMVTQWKKKLGSMLTKHVILPEMERRGIKFKGRVESSYLLAFPAGYKLYTHKKGDKKIPRRDTYLWGSEHVAQFRSPNEFFLHCKWLMEGKPLKAGRKPACECRYCDPSVTQGDISRKYRLGHVPEKPRKKGRAPQPAVADDVPYKDYRQGLDKITSASNT